MDLGEISTRLKIKKDGFGVMMFTASRGGVWGLLFVE
jgi:hypothetical protein